MPALQMDVQNGSAYEAAGRRRLGGRTPRGAGTCVSASKSARSLGWSSVGREQKKDPPDGVSGQPKTPPRARGGRQDLCLLQPPRGGGSWTFGRLAPADLDEGAAGEPAAQRGRPVRGRG